MVTSRCLIWAKTSLGVTRDDSLGYVADAMQRRMADGGCSWCSGLRFFTGKLQRRLTRSEPLGRVGDHTAEPASEAVRGARARLGRGPLGLHARGRGTPSHLGDRRTDRRGRSTCPRGRCPTIASAYLTYEGPISGGTGQVRRVDGGTFVAWNGGPHRVRVESPVLSWSARWPVLVRPRRSPGRHPWKFRLGKVD